MKANLKILLIMIPIFLIYLTITSCNGGGSGGTTTQPTTETTSPPTTTTQPPTETTSPPTTVCIDPGHGGSDTGTLGWDDMIPNGSGCEWKYDSEPDFPNEADINLDIALKLYTILNERGFIVIMTRNADIDVSLSKRTEIAKEGNSDIFISIHCNAEACEFDGNKPENDANGIETWYASGDASGSSLAGYVQEELVKLLGLRDRGKKETQSLYVLINAKKQDGTKLPAVLVETAFLTNKDNFNYIRSHTQDAANAIANGILRYFGKQTMALQATPVTPMIETYTLDVSVSPLGSGLVTPSSGAFISGTQVTITALPALGWSFDHWGGDVSGTSTSITITMNSNKNITAYFSQLPATQYTLTISINGQGSTNPSQGSHTYDADTQVTITATPASGWSFDHWGGDVSGTSTSITITMKSSKNITAYFKQLPSIASNVQITYIFYDGLVPRVESDEYVEITNLGSEPQDLTGWVLKDISDGYPSFTFPSYILAPGVKIRVYTNEIHLEWGGFSFGYGKAIWNNTTPDIAALYNAQGVEISRKSY